jgi:hypothetical protein
MKITEILENINCYLAIIKLQIKKNTTTKTVIYADGLYQAKELLTSMYGNGSVLSITRLTEKQIHEAVTANAQSQSITTPLQTSHKHSLAKKALLRLLKRNSLKVMPTIDDLKSAYSDFDAEQKRVNREYENNLKWAEIRKRKHKNKLE